MLSALLVSPGFHLRGAVDVREEGVTSVDPDTTFGEHVFGAFAKRSYG